MLRLAILAIAVTATGCLEPGDNDIIQWSDDFEACELCGWRVSGDVTRVTTYHPGEHALRLGPGTTAQHDLGIDRGTDDGYGYGGNFTDGNWVELSTDCAGPGGLVVVGAADAAQVQVTLDGRALGAFTRHYLNFPPLDPTVAHRFTSLALTAGALPCRIDNLQVRISGGTYAY